MRKDLDAKLVKRFPFLYGDRHKPMNETAMCWGFPGDGWYRLIYDLSRTLESLIKKEKEPQHFRASQVKEKFGVLRFYMTSSTDAMDDAIVKAEERSAHTCEECGKPGKLRDVGGWLITTCTPCLKKYMKEQGIPWFDNMKKAP